MPGFNRTQAIWLCCEIEALSPMFGVHVALGGGCLYKLPKLSDFGTRKDVDIVLYRIREFPEMDLRGLFTTLLTKLDINRKPYSQREHWWTSFVVKASFKGRDVDFLIPENGGELSYRREERS